MAKNNNGRSLLVFAVVAILVLIFFNCMGGRQVSTYAVVGDEVDAPDSGLRSGQHGGKPH